MSVTLNDPSAVADGSIDDNDSSVGRRLQAETTAVRLRIRWPGVRKTLREEQKQRAASTFDAAADSVSVSKKLLDTAHPAFRAATAVKTQTVDYWKRMTLPYIEPGVRLLRRNETSAFDVQMTSACSELEEAVTELGSHYEELVDSARDRLGDLFDQDDYTSDLPSLFGIEWEYPSTEPPSYLRQLSPALYEAESERMRQRFSEAVQLAEQSFAEELSQLVSHLAERLAGQADGSPKVFRDSAVGNLMDFLDRFQQLNIRSDADLDRLVEDARSVINGLNPSELRSQQGLRRHIADELTRVEASIDGWMVNRPRRNIIRRAR